MAGYGRISSNSFAVELRVNCRGVHAVLDTTPRYAEKLIHNCLQRVRQIYISINTVKK